MVMALTFVTSLGCFLISNQLSKKAVQETVEEDLMNLAKSIATSITEETNSQFTTLNTLATLSLMKDEKNDLWSKQVQLDGVKFSGKVKNLIGVNIADTNGDCYVVEGGKVNFAERDYCKSALSGKQYIQNPMINKVTNVLSMFYSVPVYNNDNKIIGTIFACTNGESLCDVCRSYTIGKTGYPVIIDRTTGITVGDVNTDNVLNFTNLSEETKGIPAYAELNEMHQRVRNGETGSGYYSYNGQRKVCAFTPIEGTNWTVFCQAPISEYSGHIITMRNMMLIVFLVSILLGVTISIVIGRSLKPLASAAVEVEGMSSGNADLSVRLQELNSGNEISHVISGINRFIGKLQKIIKNIKDSKDKLTQVDQSLQQASKDTAGAIGEILNNLENVNGQIDNQTNNVNETVSAVNQIASNIEALEKMISNQAVGVNQASTAIEEMVANIGAVNTSVDKMVSSFTSLEANVQSGTAEQADVGKKIAVIETQSQMLQDANKAIASIASQTNLLAMNAAIEAAHAGEAGAGFSVVADEIRKLSETSSAQSKTIGDELKKILGSIRQVVEASLTATKTFEEVSSNIQHTNQMVYQIKSAMEEQTAGSKQIIDVLHTMNDSTNEVRIASNEMSAGNKAVLNGVHNLQTSTMVMRDQMTQMQANADKISDTGTALSAITDRVTETIQKIGTEIDQFKV